MATGTIPSRPATLRPVQAAAFISTLDRFALAPLLVTIAAAFEVGLGTVALAATAYFLAYGLSQPLWGALSDRLGRLRLMRWALAAAALGGAASALAPSSGWLWLLRGLTGAAYGAVIPSALVYVGDTVPLSTRQGTLADVMGASATGMAVATAASGIAAANGAWRVAFAVPAVCAALVAAALWRQRGEDSSQPGESMAGWKYLAKRPRAWIVVGLALIEGALVIGTLTYFPSALEVSGISPVIAGMSVGVYGLATAVGTRVVRKAMTRLAPAHLIATGGAIVTLGLIVVGARQQVATVVLGAILFGLGFSLIHSTLQTWATAVAPDARAATIALFAGGLFAGSSLATAVAAPAAADGRFSLIFLTAAVLMAGFTVLASGASARHQDQTRGTFEVAVD